MFLQSFSSMPSLSWLDDSNLVRTQRDLVWPQWWNFADMSQLSKKISKMKIIFWFDLFLEARAEILEKKIVVFWGDLKTPKGHFEINWHLRAYCPNIYTVPWLLHQRDCIWSMQKSWYARVCHPYDGCYLQVFQPFQIENKFLMFYQLKYGFCKKSLRKNATLNSWTLSSSQKGTCSNES